MSGRVVTGAACRGQDPQHRHGAGVFGGVSGNAAAEPVGDRSLSCGQEAGRGGGHTAKKNYRTYKRGLNKEQAKLLRSLMHDFRRRPKDLKPEKALALD